MAKNEKEEEAAKFKYLKLNSNKMSTKKFERTTQEQLQFFVQILRDHPELKAGKNSPKAPRTVQNLWRQMADHLNAMRGPTRTPAKWKESLSQWKYQLRSRARKAKVQMAMTGGGPRVTDVTEFEQQALQTFGAAAVNGLPTIQALELQESTQNELQAIPLNDAERDPPRADILITAAEEGLPAEVTSLPTAEGAPAPDTALRYTPEETPINTRSSPVKITLETIYSDTAKAIQERNKINSKMLTVLEEIR